MKEAQCTDTILMVRPANFGFNEETAANNAFQDNHTELTKHEISDLAIREFDGMVDGLRAEGVKVVVIQDTSEPLKTDAVFPNNWMSTHEDGSCLWYPMFSPNRRKERRDDIMSSLSEEYELQTDKELLKYEEKGQFLEGTGSMILDRENKIVYACFSERTDQEVLESFGKKRGYKIVGFDAVDEEGLPYYHTNVIMTLGQKVAIICTEGIVDEAQKAMVLDHLEKTGKTVVAITREQVLAFAGNMLEVIGNDGPSLMVMSTSAYNSLTDDQLNIIKNHNKIVHLPIGTIEKFGGGSARCMMAEIFLPK